MVFKLEVVHKKWTDYSRAYEDLLNLMMQYQFDVETIPVLSTETEKVNLCLNVQFILRIYVAPLHLLYSI